MELNEAIEKIETLKKEIDALRPIDSETENKILQKFRLDWNYHSNNIEGNSLTFGETKSFLLHGITAEGKPLKDHLDLKGHNEALLLLDDIVKNSRPLTESFIRELHEIILHEPYDKPAIAPDGTPTIKRVQIGQYKKTPNHVRTATGEIFYFASPEETPAMMNDLMDWYSNSSNNTIRPVILASEFHYKFIRIHPFDDGNGRIARILMNIILMKNGYPPVIIKTQEKTEYYRALQMADGGDTAYFNSYIAEQLIHSLELYLRGAKGESIEETDDIDKQIALLKTKLQAATDKIVYSNANSKLIFEESIKPLFVLIDNKLKQFSELFNQYFIAYTFLKEKNTLVAGPVQKGNLNTLLNAILKSTQEQGSILFKMRITHHFKDFIKTEDKFFDCDFEYEVQLNRIDFVFNIESDKPNIRIFYHNKADNKKFNKIANIIAKGILDDIEKHLEE